MARRNTSGWEIVGGILGLGLAAGAVYVLHTKMRESVDLLLQAPLDEALQAIGASVPPMEEEVWEIFTAVLRSHAQQSRRAAQLLSFAVDVRETAPHILKMLRLPGERAVHTTFELALELSHDQWQVFLSVMGGLAQRDADAAALLSFAVDTRKHLSFVKRLSGKPLSRSKNLLVPYILGIDSEQVGILKAVLAKRSGQHARQIPDLVEYIDHTRTCCANILALRPDLAIAEIATIVPRLSQEEWDLFQHIFEQVGRANPLFHLIKPSLAGIWAASAYTDHLLALEGDAAKAELTRDIVARPDDHWSGLRIILALRSEHSARAMRLHEYAQTLHRLEAPLSELLSSPQETVDELLARIALTDPTGAAFIDLIIAYVHQHPDRDQLLERTLSAQRIQKEVEQLLRLPKSYAESQINQIAAAADQRSWRQLLLILQHRSQDHPAAAPALEYALQVRASLQEHELKLRRTIEEALSDGQITAAEQSEIQQLGATLGLPVATVDHLIRAELSAYARQHHAEHTLRQQIQQILADGIITPEEEAELAALREQLAVTSELVDRLLAEAQQHHARPSAEPAPAAQAEQHTALFRRSIQHVLQDNIITAHEGRALEELRQRLRITAEQAREILLDVQSERSGARPHTS